MKKYWYEVPSKTEFIVKASSRKPKKLYVEEYIFQEGQISYHKFINEGRVLYSFVANCGQDRHMSQFAAQMSLAIVTETNLKRTGEHM